LYQISEQKLTELYLVRIYNNCFYETLANQTTFINIGNRMRHFSRKRIISVSTLLISIFSVSACSILQPVAYDEADLLGQARSDLVRSSYNVEPIVDAITLEEALARALKYNLEIRTRMMEEALALNQLGVDGYDLLPKILAQAGYSGRNKERMTQSREVETGELSPSRFISQEKSHTLSELGVSWSLLDFGVGYYNNKQQADRVLIAYEKRRRVMHLLIQDVYIAFWRAASAQKMHDQIVSAMQVAEKALMDSRSAEAERVGNPMESLRYQRQLLENLRLLEAIGQELSNAQIELASLINAPLGITIRVVEPDMDVDRQLLGFSVDKMEELAMVNNADIREQHYNSRIARIEARKTLLQLFPNISFDYGLYYDNDRYLVNNNWNQVGAQLSFQLLNLISAPSRLRLANSGVELADQRRVMVQMAALTQMHLARLGYANALNQFERADDIWETDRRLLEQVANRQQAQVQSQLELVNSETAAILSLLRRYQALAEAHAASARLQYSLGLEPEIGSIDELNLQQIMQQIRTSQLP